MYTVRKDLKFNIQPERKEQVDFADIFAYYQESVSVDVTEEWVKEQITLLVEYGYITPVPAKK